MLLDIAKKFNLDVHEIKSERITLSSLIFKFKNKHFIVINNDGKIETCNINTIKTIEPLTKLRNFLNNVNYIYHESDEAFDLFVEEINNLSNN